MRRLGVYVGDQSGRCNRQSPGSGRPFGSFPPLRQGFSGRPRAPPPSSRSRQAVSVSLPPETADGFGFDLAAGSPDHRAKSPRRNAVIANVLVRNAWYVAGLSGEFPIGALKGQVIAEKPVVLWRAADGRMVA